MGLLGQLENLLDLRCHRRSCDTCAFFRIQDQGNGLPYVGTCLLLGRIMSLSDKWNQIADWAKERVCDGWLPRPEHVKVETKKNPYFHDPYISRETIKTLRQIIFNITRNREPEMDISIGELSDADDAL